MHKVWRYLTSGFVLWDLPPCIFAHCYLTYERYPSFSSILVRVISTLSINFAYKKREITYFMLHHIISVYPIIEPSSKNRTGYGQAAVLLGLDQYTIVTYIQKECVPKIPNVEQEVDKKNVS